MLKAVGNHECRFSNDEFQIKLCPGPPRGLGGPLDPSPGCAPTHGSLDPALTKLRTNSMLREGTFSKCDFLDITPYFFFDFFISNVSINIYEYVNKIICISDQ